MLAEHNSRRMKEAEALRKRIINILKKNGASTVPYIATKTGKTTHNIRSAVQRLQLEGKVAQDGKVRYGDGRRVQTFISTGRNFTRSDTAQIIELARHIKGPFASMIAQMKVSQEGI